MRADTGTSRRRQHGAALMLALVLLLMMTILGVSAMHTTNLQERMAGNMRDRGVAFEAAEAGLRVAESELRPLPPSPFNNTNGLYTESDPDEDPHYKTVDWSSDGAVRLMEVEGTAGDVRYIIERMDPVTSPAGPSIDTQQVAPDRQYFRITARATGKTADAVVILQTTVRQE
jgi:type IV pilus assembly protein PilX